jgi:hypothetical protein
MKKILYSLVTMATVAGGYTYAHNPERIARFLEQIDGKHVVIPQRLAKEFCNLKADMLDLGAREFAMSQHDLPEAYKSEYNEVIDTMRKLAGQLRTIRIPEKGLKKSLKLTPAWFALKAKKFQLGSKMLRLIAVKAHVRSALAMAKHKALFAEKILKGLALVKAVKSKLETEGESEDPSKTDGYTSEEAGVDPEASGSEYGTESTDGSSYVEVEEES